ncbi:MAG TPA: hypothetical protein VIY68_11715 [Steroidobacteraceae bacterium]
MILPIATALAVGVYVVLSKDVQPKRREAATGESFQYPVEHLYCDGRPEIQLLRMRLESGDAAD